MIIIILVCLGFGTSTHLTNAYGLTGFHHRSLMLITVATVMIVTTTLLALVMYFVWGFIIIIPLAFLSFFGVLDGAFWACMYPRLYSTNL
jgi:K+ transporter